MKFLTYNPWAHIANMSKTKDMLLYIGFCFNFQN